MHSGTVAIFRHIPPFLSADPELRQKSFRDKMENLNRGTEKLLNEMCDNMGLSEEVKRKMIEENCVSGIKA